MIKVFYNYNASCPFTFDFVKTVVAAVGRREKKVKGAVEINVVGESEMRKLNWLYRGKNKATDVLSFAWGEEGQVKSDLLGQIYLCYPQIIRQAKECKVAVREEFARMLVHGLLHLAGHDHAAATGAKKMFTLQENIIESL